MVLTDEFSNGYFHWITDVLPKIAWLETELANYRLVLPSYQRRFSYMLESLAPWPGLPTAVLEDGARTRLPNARVVTCVAPTGNYRPELMHRLAAVWRERVQPSAPFRLTYISRCKAPWRKIRNEAQVTDALRALGFEVVVLEDLRFAEQVRLLAESRVVVSNHGAGLTNILFQRPGTRVLEIRREGDSSNNCYFSLASALGLDYWYLQAPAAETDEDSHVADLVVDIALLRREVERVLL